MSTMLLTETRKERVRVETITPEIAMGMLTKSADAEDRLTAIHGRKIKNRAFKQTVADRYVRDMLAGHWYLSNDALVVGKSGWVLNGQHRLWAVVESQTTQAFNVMRGVENEIELMKVIDTGAGRSRSDMLALAGESNTKILGSVINMCIWHEANECRGRKPQPTHSEMEAWLDDHPDVRDASVVARNVYSAIRFNKAAVGTAFYLNSRTDDAAAYAFMKELETGVGLAAGSPVLALQRWAINATRPGVATGAPIWLAYILRAMNHWRAGKKVRLLSVRLEDGMPELWKP